MQEILFTFKGVEATFSPNSWWNWRVVIGGNYIGSATTLTEARDMVMEWVTNR